MDSPHPGAKSTPAPEASGSPNDTRLDSWKEIAAYLRRDVATVRRWEKREGLPVHRHQHDKLGSVYAIVTEIDAWSRSRSQPDSRLAATTAERPTGVSSGSWMAASALLLAVIAATFLAGALWTRPGDTPESRFLLTTEEGLVVSSLAISPDGSVIALAAAAPGQRDSIWVREIASTTPRRLPKTEGGYLPFWSPDGRRLGFFADRSLKRVDLSDGSVEVICPAGAARGGTWNKEDVIVFSSKGALMRVSVRDGAATALTNPTNPTNAGHAWPEFLPDGQRVLYYAESPISEREGVYVVGLNSGPPQRVLAVASNAIPVSDGHLLFVRDRRLMVQAFDLDTLQSKGDAVTVADSVVQQYAFRGKGDFSVSAAGVLAYRVGTTGPSPLVWINRHGTRLGTVGEPGFYGAPVLSPDGSRTAVVRFNIESRPTSIATWLIDVVTGVATRLTVDPKPNFMPLWSPTGDRVTFASSQGTTNNLVLKAVDGIEPEDVVLKGQTAVQPESWSADGNLIFYSFFDRDTGWDMWALPLSGNRQPFPVLRSKNWESQAQLSPDGRLLSYTSNETGQLQVYVTSFPSRKDTKQISINGGGDARWRHDGRELYFIAADGHLMAVPISPEPHFKHGSPQRLFQTRIRLLWEDMRNHYDVTEDGQRFLFTVPIDDALTTPFTVVTPWRPTVR